jgi:hypothetical protein
MNVHQKRQGRERHTSLSQREEGEQRTDRNARVEEVLGNGGQVASDARDVPQQDRERHRARL